MQTFSTTLIAAALVLSGAIFAQDRPGEGVTVSPAVATWESARPVEAIFSALLSELGYDVERPTSLANPIFYQAVALGDVDYWPNGWFPLHNSQLPAGFEESASIIGTIVERGAIQGYLVSAWAAEEYDITSLDDFKRPEVREAFDRNNDGRADLVACPPGWGCEEVIEHHLDVYDLREHINDIKAAYTASFADALAAHRAGEPVLYYTWTPNFTVFELVPGEDVVWINVPDVNPAPAEADLAEFMVVEGLEGAVSDPLIMGFAAADIQAVANNDFLAANPPIERLFELIEIDLIDISGMTLRFIEGEDTDEAVAAMAQEWIVENRTVVDSWLAEARAAAN
ncbi:MAG: glycine betaine/L-proline ABC transporter substrate-binding protein ProX [Trueperaceae bacterium]|nr:glycine betaine/L-proline ABC transporter substrate-binding protein ProX [Trueperaceae bacterium]